MAQITFIDTHGKELELWHLRAGHKVVATNYETGTGQPKLTLTVTLEPAKPERALKSDAELVANPGSLWRPRTLPQPGSISVWPQAEPGWQRPAKPGLTKTRRLLRLLVSRRTSPLEGEWEAM